jgi:rhomboid protease GluP
MAATPSYDELLRRIGGASPHPWYPSEFARSARLDSGELDAALDKLRLGGLIEFTDWEAGRGQGFVLTSAGIEVLRSARALARLRNGTIPQWADRFNDNADDLPPTTALGRGDAIRNSLLRDTKPRVTQVLIVLNLLVFLGGVVYAVVHQIPIGRVLGMGNIRVLHASGAVSGVDLIDGQWWRLMSACFVHIGLLHLGFNMYSLHSIGGIFERIWGRSRYLAIYLVAGFGGSCLAMATGPRVMLAGASGSLCGMLAALIVWVYLNKRYLPPRLASEWMTQLSSSFILIVLISLMPNVSWAGHLGGAVAGGLMAAMLNFHRYRTDVVRHFYLLVVPLTVALSIGLLVRSQTMNREWRTLIAAVKDDDDPEPNPRERGQRPNREAKFAPDWSQAIQQVERTMDDAEKLRKLKPRNRPDDDVKAAVATLAEAKARLTELSANLNEAVPSDRVTAARRLVDERLKQLELLSACLSLGGAWTEDDDQKLEEQTERANRRFQYYRNLMRD